MTAYGKVTIDGAAELQASFKKFADATNDLKRVHGQAGDLVVKVSKPRARRLTGRMGNSVRATGQAKQAVVRVGFPRFEYIDVQYYGWPKHNISPDPFLEETIESEIGRILEVYGDGIMDIAKDSGLL